jgi:hypothetical protein
LSRALAGQRRGEKVSRYSRTFAHIRRQKAAEYRQRQKQAHLIFLVLWVVTHSGDGTH